jgi:hypothetical protein
MHTGHSCRVFPALIFIACLSACASSSGTLYSWGSYEAQVYAYLKGESRERQIDALERDREKIELSGKAVPPGFYAHLGLLYAETGNNAMAMTCFEMEKARFPKDTAYIDLLFGGYGN